MTVDDACIVLREEKGQVDSMSLIISIVIVVINQVLTVVSLSLIQWIKYQTKSAETSALVKALFILLFFNSGIIILIMNMDFESEHEPSELLSLFNGRYTDYSPMWYRDVGN